MSTPQSRLSRLAGHFWAPPAAERQYPIRRSNHRHELSPTYFLPRAAGIEPAAEAIVHTGVTGQVIRRSYQEFADRARGLGYFIKSGGYKRVGILAPNTPAFLESIYGIAAGGAVQVGVNYRLKAEDVQYIFTHAEVDLIIVDREYLHLLDGFNPRIKRVIDEDSDGLSGEFDAAIQQGLEWDAKYGARGWEGLHTEAEDEEDVIALAYTSGTTAKPKGVEYTHRGAYLAALANTLESGLSQPSVMPRTRAKYLTILPLFHAMGWTFPWAVVAARGTHYCLRKIDYGLMWRLLSEEGVTHFNAAPTVNTLLCAHPDKQRLQNPVRVTVAASPPSAKLFRDMIELNLMPVHVYGLTETYGPITRGYFLPEWHGLEGEEMYRKMARQGHGFVTSKSCRVVRADGKDVARNGAEIGEVVFEGNICAKGYYKDPVATEKLFRGGVLHTEDLAVWHPDGSIQILDRKKDIIISGGENISSVSLEAMLVQHPDVVEVGVVAVPDEKYGERPRAFVTVRNGANTTGDMIVQWAKDSPHISGFMVPREVVVVEELPKTSTGKIQKNVLREWVRKD